MNDKINLPEPFGDLARYLDWALPTADERQNKRRMSSREEIKEFYEGLLPRMESILKEVDKFPYGKLPASHQALYNLALSVAEVAPHIELYNGNPAVPFAFEESRFVAVHGGDPTWLGNWPNPSHHDR